ncbi:cupin domain-containing protein [bacterium]|nr:MAG: cupin domain-containing protein [bacterium]
MEKSIERIIQQLELQPHPEGGWYRETWRSDEVLIREDGKSRSSGTAIYFLVPQGIITSWHKVKSAEMWHFYAGSPLILELETELGDVEEVIMSSNLDGGFVPQVLVKPNQWQRAYSTGLYSLVGCTVSPGFDFEDFEMR